MNNRDLVEFSYDLTDSSNYIKDVYYDYETDKAVKFTNQTSDRYFWMPKSMIKHGWEKNQQMPQNIKVRYHLELPWQTEE